MGWPYVAFDLNPSVVKASSKLGFPTLYGDGSRLLQSAGINSQKAAMIMYTGKKTIEAVQRLQLAFPMAKHYEVYICDMLIGYMSTAIYLLNNCPKLILRFLVEINNTNGEAYPNPWETSCIFQI